MEGDLVLLVLTGSAGGRSLWSDDGWTTVDGSMAAGGMVLRRIATAAQPSTLHRQRPGRRRRLAQAVLLVYRGTDASNPMTWVNFDSVGSASTTFSGSPFTVWSPDTASVMVGIVSVKSYAGVVTPGSGWTTATSVTQPGGLPGAVLVVDRPVVQNTPYTVTATVATASTGTVMTLALRPGPRAVELSWTASADPGVTGYSWTRSGSGGPASGTVSGRTTTSLTDTTLPDAESAAYSLSLDRRRLGVGSRRRGGAGLRLSRSRRRLGPHGGGRPRPPGGASSGGRRSALR